MKRSLICILALILLVSGVSKPCAAVAVNNAEIVYLEDGSHFEITVRTTPGSRIPKTVSGVKVYSYYDANDVLQWEFTVAGVFEYEYGQYAICTHTACDVSIKDSAWSCKSKSAIVNNDCAIGEAEVVLSFLFVPIQTIPVTTVFGCDVYGNLS